MEKSEIFEREINLIKREDYRKFVRNYLDNYAPSYFWEIGASSSGKFHPQFAQGNGGLVRHTKAVVMFAEELLKMSSYAYMDDEYKDYAIMACICHDTCKYGIFEYNKDEYSLHAENASLRMIDCWSDMFDKGELNNADLPELLRLAVISHMGQWGKDKPFTSVDRLVHLADYVASRNFIDIPILSSYDD